MPYTRTQRQLWYMFAGPFADGLITPAKLKKITTPPPTRIFHEYMRPHCPFRHYLKLRNYAWFNKYLDIHRRKRTHTLVNPPINVTHLIHRLKSQPKGAQASTRQLETSPALRSFSVKGRPGGFSIPQNILYLVLNLRKQHHKKSRRDDSVVAGGVSLRNTESSSALEPRRGDTTRTPFMQNEPNFRNTRLTVTDLNKIIYKRFRCSRAEKNKPKTNPNEPNSVPISYRVIPSTVEKSIREGPAAGGLHNF